MSTSTQPNSSQEYVDFDEYIDYQIQKTRAGIKTTDILTALVGVSALVLSYVLIFVVFDHWIIAGGFSRTTRFLMLGLVLLAAAGWVVWKVVRPYMKRVTGLYAAREIEKNSPNLKSTLINLIDLQQSGREIPEEIHTSMEKRAAVTLSHMNVDEVVDRRPLMATSYALLAVIVLWCGYSLFSPKKISNSVLRALLPASDVEVATQTEILDIKPGDIEVLARTQLLVTADLLYRTEIPPEVRLFYSTDDGRLINEPIEMRLEDEFSKRFECVITGENGRGILQNLSYRVEADDAVSRDFKVTVVQAPSASIDEIHYEFPPYMELEPRTQPDGHIDTWEGTRVTIRASTNMPITSARLLFSDTEDISQRAEERVMQITGGNKLSVTIDREIRFREDGSFPRYYRIECRNAQRQTTIDPTLYSVNIRPDHRPIVELIDPVRDLERPANAVVPLLLTAHDPDFQLRSLTLRMEKNGEPATAGIPIFEGRQKRFATQYRWNLEQTNLLLKQGDTLTYWIEARDNKPPTGNRTNTRKMKILIAPPASKDDVEEQLENDEQRQQEKIEELQDQPEQSPDQQPQDSDDQGEGKQSPSEDPSEKKDPQEGDQDSESSSQEDGDKGKQDPSGDSGEQSEQGEKGEQQSFDKSGNDDQEVTRKLLERFQKEQQEQKQEGGDQQKPDQQQSENKQPENKEEGNASPMPDQSQQDPNKPDSGKEKPDTGDKSQNGNSSGPDDKQNGDPDKNTQDKGGAGGSDSASDQKPDDTDQQKSGKGTKESDADSQNNKQPMDGSSKSKGKEEPTDNATDPEQQKATGKETGKARPNDNPMADPTQAEDNNQLQRKPGEKPSLNEDTNNKSQKPADFKDKTQKGRPNAGKEAPRNKGKKRDDGKAPDTEKRQPTPSKDDPEKSPSAPQKTDAPQSNDDLKGKSKNQGEDKKNKQGGEEGDNKPNEQGNQGSQESGKGDPSQKPGSMQESDKPAGKDGAGSKKGQKKKSSGNKGGDSKGGQKSGSEKSDAKKSTSPVPGGEGNDTPKGGGRTTGDKGDASAGSGAGESGKQPEREDANEEYAEQAANLVLNKLEKELQRGEADEKLLKELGWNEDDLKKFAGRLRENLGKERDADTPQSRAQRLQFQEWLKSLDLKSTGRRRKATDGPKRSVDSIQGRDIPPPVEYKSLFEAYTRRLNKAARKQSQQK